MIYNHDSGSLVYFMQLQGNIDLNKLVHPSAIYYLVNLVTKHLTVKQSMQTSDTGHYTFRCRTFYPTV